MYKQCTTEDSLRRQQQIARSLLELMLSMPYSRITVAHICEQVGLSRKSFYRYFDCKEDCLHALLDHVIIGFLDFYPYAHTTPCPSRDYLEQYFTYWKQQHDLLDALYKNDLISLVYERTMLHVDKQLRNYPDDDHYEQFLFMICGTTSLILNWHIHGYRKTAAQMAATVDRLIAEDVNFR